MVGARAFGLRAGSLFYLTASAGVLTAGEDE
ncbi:MAG: hypothetical protein HW385_604 [candidate division NC10 bacterium]|nr:hypothetical protein [candidate division NC10 bacterium]